MELKLRSRLTEKDPETIRNITADTGFFRPEELKIAEGLAEEALKKPDEYLFYFAENPTETLGYACYAEIPCTVGSYEIYWLAVRKSAQGLGIGRLLTEAAEEDIAKRKGRKIYISTSGSSLYSGTRAFYKKLGYRKDAVLKDFYLPGEDQVIYVKDI